MEKINIAEILKDCPKGMELDCTMFDNVTFVGVNTGREFPIEIKVGCDTKYLTKEGCYHRLDCIPSAKCVIFPKGKTTWEGFQRPFKDGDVLVGKSNQPFIFKKLNNSNGCISYCGIDCGRRFLLASDHWTFANSLRFATEEEKQKLFDAIKANGYKWNPETKTLKKLIEPKFKVGDRIKDKYTHKDDCAHECKIIKVNNDTYTVDSCDLIFFKDQDKYELVPNKFDISTLKPFDKVLVRDNNKVYWVADIYSHHLGKNKPYQFACIGMVVKQCIPYKGNEHLLGTTDDCDEYFKTWE